MYLSIKLHNPFFCILVRRKQLGVFTPHYTPPPPGGPNPPLRFATARNDWLNKGIRFCAIIEDPRCREDAQIAIIRLALFSSSVFAERLNNIK